MSELIIYEDQSQGLEIRLEGETLWLNLGQMAELFGVNKPAISKHLSNIYSSKELSREATISKMETVQKEGGRVVRRNTDHYNLDAVISVGYAESAPDEKETMIRLFMNMLVREVVA